MNPDETGSSRNSAESKTERDLFRIMTFSTALGFGLLAAFLYSMGDLSGKVSFVFSFGTVIWFVLGALCGWALWRGVRYLMRRE